MFARASAALIVGFARVMTGVRALWHGGAPQATPTVYFANHTSHGDFVLLWSVLPPDLRGLTRPVAAADYWQGSRLRRFLAARVFRALLIDRLGRAGSPCPIETMGRSLSAGDSLILFPEGTRNTGDEPLLPLRAGLFHLARTCPEVRLVPVWIENLRRVLPKGSLLPVPLACSVEFGPPLQRLPDEGRTEFMARARNALLALRRDPG